VRRSGSRHAALSVSFYRQLEAKEDLLCRLLCRLLCWLISVEFCLSLSLARKKPLCRLLCRLACILFCKSEMGSVAFLVAHPQFCLVILLCGSCRFLKEVEAVFVAKATGGTVATILYSNERADINTRYRTFCSAFWPGWPVQRGTSLDALPRSRVGGILFQQKYVFQVGPNSGLSSKNSYS
jgi:hypothetical protein